MCDDHSCASRLAHRPGSRDSLRSPGDQQDERYDGESLGDLPVVSAEDEEVRAGEVSSKGARDGSVYRVAWIVALVVVDLVAWMIAFAAWWRAGHAR